MKNKIWERFAYVDAAWHADDCGGPAWCGGCFRAPWWLRWLFR